jgi:hypothetical protein
VKLFDPIRATRLGARIKTIFMKIASVDVAIVGFPKCGNTWYSALLRTLLIERYGLDRSRMNRLFVSDLGAWPFGQMPHSAPRIYKSHCMPYPFEAGLRGTKEILVAFLDIPMIIQVRDPKDALVSYYMHSVYRDRLVHFSGDTSEFIRSPVFGIGKFVDYYNTVMDFRAKARAPTVIRSYEDLWSDPPRALGEDCEFIGIDGLNDDVLTRVADACSLQNMRKLELAATAETAPMPGLFRSDNKHTDAFKVRKGGVGNWKEYLTAEDAAYIDKYMNDHLRPEYRQFQVRGPDLLRSSSSVPARGSAETN